MCAEAIFVNEEKFTEDHYQLYLGIGFVSL